MTTLHLDYESRSTVDLPETGVYVYAADPTTDIWCAAWAINDGEPRLWLPGEPLCGEFADALNDPNVSIAAHNAQFEWSIANLLAVRRYRWPRLPVERFKCSMAQAYAMSLPGSLEAAGAALGLADQKDPAGRRLMLQMSRPRSIENGVCVWWDDEERRKRLYAYCLQDVRAEQALSKRLRPLSAYEQRVWVLDQRINARGVFVDAPLCRQAMKIIGAATDQLDKEMKKVTDGTVSAVSNTSQLLKFVKIHVPDCESVKKDSVVDLLVERELPPNVQRALELRQEGAKTSTAKIDTLLTGMSGDGRARGLLQYHAASTGRWGGRRFQPQNLPRPKLKPKDIAKAIEMIGRGDHALIDMVYGAPLSVISDCIRSLVSSSDGRDLLAADFANIEGRVIAWWAGEHWKLDAFRAYDAGTGPDLYKVTASKIFGVPIDQVDDLQRQIGGKVPELACGYQGGVFAFIKMADTYGFKIADQCDVVLRAARKDHIEQAKVNFYKARIKPAPRAFVPAEVIKLAWREENPAIVSLWGAAGEAAIQAVEHPGTIKSVGPVRWRVAGSFLWCQLPSGRFLCYPYPHLIPQVWVKRQDKSSQCIERAEAVRMGWLDGHGHLTETARVDFEITDISEARPKLKYKGVDSRTHKWGDLHTYGGKIVENVVQAIARDFMADAMLRVETAGYPIVLTVHDEIMAEPRCDFGSLEQFCSLMGEVPAWGAGCPIAVAGWRGERYRK